MIHICACTSSRCIPFCVCYVPGSHCYSGVLHVCGPTRCTIHGCMNWAISLTTAGSKWQIGWHGWRQTGGQEDMPRLQWQRFREPLWSDDVWSLQELLQKEHPCQCKVLLQQSQLLFDWQEESQSVPGLPPQKMPWLWHATWLWVSGTLNYLVRKCMSGAGLPVCLSVILMTSW